MEYQVFCSAAISVKLTNIQSSSYLSAPYGTVNRHIPAF